jgi:hypothetical protein
LPSESTYISKINYGPLSAFQGHKLNKTKSKFRIAKSVKGGVRATTAAIARTRPPGEGAGAGVMIMVPIDTLKMLRMRAAQTGTTVRALVLKSLQKIRLFRPAGRTRRPQAAHARSCPQKKSAFRTENPKSRVLILLSARIGLRRFPRSVLSCS